MTGREAIDAVKNWAIANPLYVKEIAIFVAGLVVGKFVL